MVPATAFQPTCRHPNRRIGLSFDVDRAVTNGVPCYASPKEKEDTNDRASSTASLPEEWRGQVLSKLQTIIDPDLGSDIVTLGFIQKLQLMTDDDAPSATAGKYSVSFEVELTTPACPVKDQFAVDCKARVLELPWVDSVHVTMTAQENLGGSTQTDTFGMQKVGAVIAVSSCKGGVGKSTTAVNLAFALQAAGATVGIFDADIYGPSLPTMVKPDNDIVKFVGRQIAPLQRNGVRLMSFGYVNDGSAVMRGPMVTQLLDQFLSVTHWGSLDYLIIDMPPGTGDIQLTLTQRLNITAAVIVTTPQELSFADVVRGVEMFDSVAVPAIAVVENMAYYEVEKQNVLAPLIDSVRLKTAIVEKLQSKAIELNGGSLVGSLADELVALVVQQQKLEQQTQIESMPGSTKERVQIFGTGHKKRLSDLWGIEHTFSVPLLDQIAANGDAGTPYILQYPQSSQSLIYKELASAVVSEVAKIKFAEKGLSSRPSVEYVKDEHVILVDNSAKVSPAALRRECRCAACVEEMTGRQLLVKTNIPETVKPRKMYPTGNYALSIDWSDGHRSLYPYRQIRSLVAQLQQSQPQNQAAATVG